MKNMLIGLGVAAAMFIVFVVCMIIVIVGYYNKEVSLRNQFVAQEEANTVVYDEVWKVISQQAQVADTYKEGFREVWQAIVSGNSAANRQASLAVFVNHHNPQFDSKIYISLMNTIEGKRREFTNNQKKLIDIKREHDNLRTRFPSSVFVGSRPELQLHLVTSDRTEDVFKAGKDNDVQVFPKEK